MLGTGLVAGSVWSFLGGAFPGSGEEANLALHLATTALLLPMSWTLFYLARLAWDSAT